MPKRHLPLALTLGAVLAALAPVPPASASADACPVVDGTAARCGNVTVPLIRSDPAAGTTRVAYALLPRTRTSRPAAGTVMLVPGGPGDPAIAQAQDFATTTAALRADHDLLLVDPRGIGRSQRHDCGLPADYLRLSYERQTDEVGRCGRRFGAKARAFTSAELADDLDAVREHLGIDRVFPYGLSYGTYLSTIYAARHPGHTQGIVQSGAYPVRFDPLARPGAQTVERALRRLCARSGGACRGEEAVANLKRLAARLRHKPIPFRIEVSGRPRTMKLGERMLALMHLYVASLGGVPHAWTELPAAVAEAVAGDTRALIALAQKVSEQLGRSLPPESRAVLAMSVSIQCNDYPAVWDRKTPPSRRPAVLAKALRRAEGEFGPFSARSWYEAFNENYNCQKWPGALGPAEPGPAPGVPVLVLSGELDTNTPVPQGREAAAQFPSATFVEVPSAGHVPTEEDSGCAARLAATFIRTGSTGDRSCLKSIPPLPVRRTR
ncbi:alpha/beta hydrolase [Spongiactinospora rosea]|uniref:Alpha/beta hydrolase n=1 Tax=Spongiactinospora rosea TaxID=2248750 RepID=A0A366LS22_9ACTN|nr:alpha/beta fold hydrolase [Spongiactinospora rosea]RBQ16708.1 alpha/beta hydrolase [Spongiactinospora rosea]